MMNSRKAFREEQHNRDANGKWTSGADQNNGQAQRPAAGRRSVAAPAKPALPAQLPPAVDPESNPELYGGLDGLTPKALQHPAFKEVVARLTKQGWTFEDEDWDKKNTDLQEDRLKEAFTEVADLTDEFLKIVPVKIDAKLAIGDIREDKTSAHYDPGANVIRIFEANGESLPHELAHYFDYRLARGASGENSEAFTDTIADTDAGWAWNEVWQKVMDRYENTWEKENKRYKRIATDYLTQPTEIFARVFEQYVYQKSKRFQSSQPDLPDTWGKTVWMDQKFFDKEVVPLVDKFVAAAQKDPKFNKTYSRWKSAKAHKPGSGPVPRKVWLPEGLSFDAPSVKKHLGPGPHPDGTPQSVHGGSPTANPHRREVLELGAEASREGQSRGGPHKAAARERVQRLQALVDAMDANDQAAGNAAWNALPHTDRVRLENIRHHFQKEADMSLNDKISEALAKAKHEYHSAKMERCLADLKANGHSEEEAHRICYSSLGAKANKEFDESKFNRRPKGDPKGGQFAPKGAGGQAGQPIQPNQAKYLDGLSSKYKGKGNHSQAAQLTALRDALNAGDHAKAREIYDKLDYEPQAEAAHVWDPPQDKHGLADDPNGGYPPLRDKPFGDNPKGYDWDRESGAPSLKGTREFVADLRDEIPDILKTTTQSTGRGDMETPRGVDYINQTDFAGEVRKRMIGLGIDPEFLDSDFGEFIDQALPWKNNLQVGEGEKDWNDGDKLVWADDQEARDIGQAMEDYIEVGLGENVGPEFVNSTKMGTVVRWGESGGERFGNFSRRTGMPKSGEDVFVRHNGLFTEAKYLNQAGDVRRGGNLHLRTPQGRDIYAWPDQLWNETALKGLMLDMADNLAKDKPRKKC